MDDLTVSIVTYNNAGEISGTLDALLAHLPTGRSCRVYVVDNASRDGTRAILDGYRERGLITAVYLERNVGFGAAHNAVLAVLDSTYHLVMNPDITLESDALTTLCAFMDARPDVGLLTPRVENPDGTRQALAVRQASAGVLLERLFSSKVRSRAQRRFLGLDADMGAPLEVSNASGCFMFLRTRVYKSINGFDESFFLYFEDFDLARRMGREAKIYYLPVPGIVHKWHRTSRKRLWVLLIMIRSAVKYLIGGAWR